MVGAEITKNVNAPDTPLPRFVSQALQPPSIAPLPMTPIAWQPPLPTSEVMAGSLEGSPYAAFMEYHQMILLHKKNKIKAMFHHLSEQEIEALMIECGHNEDEVILKLITQPTYLSEIRAKYPAPRPSTQPHEQVQETSQAPEIHYAPKDTIPDPAFHPSVNMAIPPMIPGKFSAYPTEVTKKKKQSRMSGGRLALDDALKQAQSNPQSGFEGWSQARIRAYKMIDENPNSYYYRFNAPGEEQRKGQWSDEERALFFARLSEVGANSQWGIFSMSIPGRVGYQCSNFYRLLIETSQVLDPNYVLDEKGKAHYLFDKKTSDGQVQKTFRTHIKHGSRRQIEPIKPPKAPKLSMIKRRKKSKDDDDTDDFKDYKVTAKSALPTTRRRTRHTTAVEAAEAEAKSEAKSEAKTEEEPEEKTEEELGENAEEKTKVQADSTSKESTA